MICDGQKPVAMAGVMGGLNSEIEDTTTWVLIESACFNPASIRRTAKRFNLGTDASHRFERGVDPGGTVRAMERAAHLMVEICGGKWVDGIIDAYPGPVTRTAIELSVDRTNRILGTDLTSEQMTRLSYNPLNLMSRRPIMAAACRSYRLLSEWISHAPKT